MLPNDDTRFANEVNALLSKGITPEAVAKELGIAPSTLRTRLAYMGYEIKTVRTRRLVPKRAPELDSTG